MAYYYFKEKPKTPGYLKTVLHFIPALIFTTGIVILVYAGWPIISYELALAPKFQESKVIKPYFTFPQNENLFSFGVVGAGQGDLTEIQNWFPKNWQNTNISRTRYYNLSISNLGIFNAVVSVGGENLSEGLIHYGGTAYPGSFGNAVIFGHSVLPQFFNPHDYMTIFSTLPTLKMGDEIIVDFDGVRYCYQVEEMVEVEPEDLSILEQRFDDSYLTLITCVPPGTYLRRLVVKARLVK